MPTYPTQPFGQRGEQLASAYLRQRGYAIVGTNWRCKQGEIDIIARQDGILVFVEVRSRHADDTEGAFASVTVRKQRRMTAAAHAYLAAHGLDHFEWRIDVIAVAIPRTGQAIIEHVEDALGW